LISVDTIFIFTTDINSNTVALAITFIHLCHWIEIVADSAERLRNIVGTIRLLFDAPLLNIAVVELLFGTTQFVWRESIDRTIVVDAIAQFRAITRAGGGAAKRIRRQFRVDRTHRRIPLRIANNHTIFGFIWKKYTYGAFF
jgi:hypothetical protein